MNVSVDGARRNLAHSYDQVVAKYHTITEDSECHGRPCLEEMQEALAALRQDIAALMCIYSKDPSDLMNNMSAAADKLAVP